MIRQIVRINRKKFLLFFKNFIGIIPGYQNKESNLVQIFWFVEQLRFT